MYFLFTVENNKSIKQINSTIINTYCCNQNKDFSNQTRMSKLYLKKSLVCNPPPPKKKRNDYTYEFYLNIIYLYLPFRYIFLIFLTIRRWVVESGKF